MSGYPSFGNWAEYLANQRISKSLVWTNAHQYFSARCL